eukprot:NODE_73_length_24441_cov_0.672952.p13 type:complete len:188 gc:universal NODE_73_length_24441_cov_0.672952:16013-15450(-)
MQALREPILNAPIKMRSSLLNSLKSSYQLNPLISQFTSLLMKDGKKQKALNQVLSALDFIVQEETNKSGQAVPSSTSHALKTLEKAVGNAQPIVGLKRRKMKNKIEIQPRPLSEKQGKRLSLLWIIKEASKRKDKISYSHKLGIEIMDAASGKSNAIQKKDTLHEEAIKNRSALNRLARIQNFNKAS